MALLTTK